MAAGADAALLEVDCAFAAVAGKGCFSLWGSGSVEGSMLNETYSVRLASSGLVLLPATLSATMGLGAAFAMVAARARMKVRVWGNMLNSCSEKT